MKIMKTLETAMPQLIHLSQSEVDEARKNVTRLFNQKKLTFIEKYNEEADLYFEGDDNNQSWSLFNKGSLMYFVLVKKVKLFNGDAVRQTRVDRVTSDALSQGVAQYVIFHKLIPKYKSLASDCQQSDHGQRMWINLVGTVLKTKPHLTVTLLNTTDKTVDEITSLAELDKHHAWGESSFHQRFILVISEN